MINRQPTGRKAHEIRPLEVQTGINRYAEGSVLIKMGFTHVLCTASFTKGVPEWLEGKGSGWITGEYAMLPRSTHSRIKREKGTNSGRSQEIQRLVGRSLRAMVDMKKLGENTIIIDCDVLQADGGTRTAAVNGGCVALALAVNRMLKNGTLSSSPLIDTVGAISVGLSGGEVLVDLDYNEDSSIDTDMNFVMTGKGQFIEVQGTGEKAGFDFSQLQGMTQAAQKAIREISKLQESWILSAK